MESLANLNCCTTEHIFPCFVLHNSVQSPTMPPLKYASFVVRTTLLTGWTGLFACLPRWMSESKFQIFSQLWFLMTKKGANDDSILNALLSLRTCQAFHWYLPCVPLTNHWNQLAIKCLRTVAMFVQSFCTEFSYLWLDQIILVAAQDGNDSSTSIQQLCGCPAGSSGTLGLFCWKHDRQMCAIQNLIWSVLSDYLDIEGLTVYVYLQQQ